ncbi:MAG TPA: hypothetical protein DDZ51_03910 [Planctomycetaceae bacterium]|nr:hypothetical protein [Planctomycetaceae bacterium]
MLSHGAIFVVILCGSFSGLPQLARAQGFFFGPGYGPGYGPAPGWRPRGWAAGYGVAPSRIDISIGVAPSFPHPIGVPPSHFFPQPFPDYRSQYTLRVLQSHQAQLEFAETLGLISPLGVRPLDPAEVYHQFGGAGLMRSQEHVLSQRPLDHSGLDGEWPDVTAEGIQAISDQMIQSARRLDETLARRGEEGDVWRQYLSTAMIVASDQQPLADAQWVKVLQNFDGVVANGDLRWVMRSDGFAETRHWVNAWVNAKAGDAIRSGAVGNDASVPPEPPRPPEPPKPVGRPPQDYEVLPAPDRAKL